MAEPVTGFQLSDRFTCAVDYARQLHTEFRKGREAMREAEDIRLGDPDTTVEIDGAYIGGRLRHESSKVAQASKTMVIGMAERNGWVHLESMSNR